MRQATLSLLSIAVWIPALVVPATAQDPEADVAAARELFERNIKAIQERHREDYLACYRADDRLARVGPDGIRLGFAELRDGTAATGSDEWPEALVARDLRLTWVGPGHVYGTYRYRVIFNGVATQGISGRTFVKDPDGWRIAVTSAFQAPDGIAAPALALVGATVFDGRGGEPIEDAVILVRDGRITSIGTRSDVEIPDGVDTVDCSGRFITPGLIDSHVHYSQTGWADGRPDSRNVTAEYPYEVAMAECEKHPERFHRAFLHSGVTAVFDVGGYPWTRRLRDPCEQSPDAPHVAATGALMATLDPPQLQLPDSTQFVLMEDEDALRAAVRSHAALGSDAIKSWFIVRQGPRLEPLGKLLDAISAEAKKVGLPLVVHATTLETARRAVAAGANLLVHSVDDRAVDDDFVAAAVAAKVIYCPTLTVFDGYRQLYVRELSDEVRSQLPFVDPSVRERVLKTESLGGGSRGLEQLRERMKQRGERRMQIMSANLARLHGAGVRIAMGTDAGNPLTLHGPSVFPEMEAMQAAGMKPLEVLTASTLRAAQAMGRGDDLGVLEAGRIADLLVLEKSPEAGIENMRSILQVMRAGVLHERAHLMPLPKAAAEK